jgi:hypothetical protein
VTQASTAFSVAADSAAAGRELGATITHELGRAADAIIVFAAPGYDHEALLRSLKAACPSPAIVGCSSAGEFATDAQAENAACAIGFVSDDMLFTAALGRELDTAPERTATTIVESFRGPHRHDYRYRSALVLADALAGNVDHLIETLARASAGTYQFVGGGAGDNAQFANTPVFYDTEVVHHAAVALEMLSKKPLGIGVQHGWEPATEPMRVTSASGMTVMSLNATSAVEVFEEYARTTGQRFDRENPIPFFLHNIIGVRADDSWRLRVPLTVAEDGSITCAAEIPAGATVAIMRASVQSAAHAAAAAARAALDQLGENPAQAAIFFDCVATRLRLGRDFGMELATLRDAIGPLRLVGCNTHGQIARAEGQFSGFHNCTAVVCVIPA